MPYRTKDGSHYHMTEGCHNAFIRCGTDGLEPCRTCCQQDEIDMLATPRGDATYARAQEAAAIAGSRVPQRWDDDPDDRPAEFRDELRVDIRDEGVFALRITPRDRGDVVSSKGELIGRAPGPRTSAKRAAHLMQLLSVASPRKGVTQPMSLVDPAPTAEDYEGSLYFDMDGTIADLYAVDGWLDKLRASDASPYDDAAPLVDMDELRRDITDLQSAGWRVGVISWLAKVRDPEYDCEVAMAKRRWLARHLPMLDEINLVAYGVPKSQAVEGAREAVLFDDEEHNLAEWTSDDARRVAISAKDPETMMAALGWLVESVKGRSD